MPINYFIKKVSLEPSGCWDACYWGLFSENNSRIYFQSYFYSYRQARIELLNHRRGRRSFMSNVLVNNGRFNHSGLEFRVI
jgi:hypothetical protein